MQKKTLRSLKPFGNVLSTDWNLNKLLATIKKVFLEKKWWSHCQLWSMEVDPLCFGVVWQLRVEEILCRVEGRMDSTKYEYILEANDKDQSSHWNWKEVGYSSKTMIQSIPLLGQYGSGGKSSCLAVGGLQVRSHPGYVEVSLSKTPNP